MDLPKEAVGAQLSENAAAKLKLDVSPSDVDIALEKENGEQVLLDEIKSIAEQGVRDGSKVLVTVREPSFCEHGAGGAWPLLDTPWYLTADTIHSVDIFQHAEWKEKWASSRTTNRLQRHVQLVLEGNETLAHAEREDG